MFNILIPAWLTAMIMDAFLSKRSLLSTKAAAGIIALFSVHDWMVGSWILNWQPLLLPYGFLLCNVFFSFETIMHIKTAVRQRNEDEEKNMKNALIADTVQMVAHDVRRPFSQLSAGLNAFECFKSFDEVKDFIPILKESLTESLAGVNMMLSDVIDVGRDIKIEASAISLVEVVEKSLAEISAVYTRANVSMKYEWGHLYKVLGERERLKRVFSNLLSNAIDSMKDGHAIWIKTKQDRDFLLIEVGNSGSYIPENKLGKVFDRFYTEGKGSRGTGLGLTIVKRILDAHQSTITVHSDKELKKVWFVIKLPSSDSLDASRMKKLSPDLKDFDVQSL